MRMMKDKKNFALDTLSREEMLLAASQCLNENKGDLRYKSIAVKVVNDYKANKNLYITLKMRRVLMGFIRPVFKEEWLRREGGRERLDDTFRVLN